MNLFELLVGEDNHPALVTPEGRSLTYQQLRDNVLGLVTQLNSFGLKRGERIAIAMSNGSPMAITLIQHLPAHLRNLGYRCLFRKLEY
ncbi:AMP-binding protein [Nostoc sp.]|uniref:AMP-binding protein n=1 Tax=Nostoc sp. TaxID=1180 RepID=UPI002FF78A9D